jgi:hypothetical protein
VALGFDRIVVAERDLKEEGVSLTSASDTPKAAMMPPTQETPTAGVTTSLVKSDLHE